jgi:chorismate synthase
MRYLTAGESHGPQLTVIIDGVPSHLPISIDQLNEEMARRQKGHGRGKRMQIEKDRVSFVAGVRHGETTGAPIAMVIENRDWSHWTDVMSVEPVPDPNKRRVSRPRPGHADLNGAIKYNQRDMRNILERSSARETAARVAVGALAKQILAFFNIDVGGHVVRISDVKAEGVFETLQELKARSEASPVRCIDKAAEARMIAAIDKAKAEGDSLGGVVEVIVDGVPIGLGSHVQWDRKLDAKIARAIVSINAFKGVEFGLGFAAAQMPGSQVHDEIGWAKGKGFYRKTNRLGGFEGGMTNGEPIVVRGVMKPIPTLYKPLQSVDIDSKEPFAASIERSDNCAVPAASVVAEAVVAWEVADAFLEKFGADEIHQINDVYQRYLQYAREF